LGTTTALLIRWQSPATSVRDLCALCSDVLAPYFQGNDISIAIAHVIRSCEAKVLYIDFDVHHGDGVQQSFYDEPRVMKVSFHETGGYLKFDGKTRSENIDDMSSKQ
jgi:hypothetical protein